MGARGGQDHARRQPRIPVHRHPSRAYRPSRRLGGPQAYFGDPAGATWEEGEQTIQILGQILADAVLQEMGMIST